MHSKASKKHLLELYHVDSSNLLGKGGFGQVYKAYHKLDGSEIAIKTVGKSGLSKAEISNLCRELDILQKVDHPNITKYFENYEDENFIYICMELMEGGDLHDKHFPDAKISHIMKKLLLALKHCHD